MRHVLQGWTKAFSRISDVGVGAYFHYFALYMALVEFGIYWMHRLLHDIKPGYRCAPLATMPLLPSTLPQSPTASSVHDFEGRQCLI